MNVSKVIAELKKAGVDVSIVEVDGEKKVRVVVDPTELPGDEVTIVELEARDVLDNVVDEWKRFWRRTLKPALSRIGGKAKK